MNRDEKKAYSSPSLDPASETSPQDADYHANDVFGHEEDHQIQYKTLSWPLVAVLMIAEIVSNGMLSLPSSLAVVGLVPGIIVIVFLGTFGLFTAWVLIQFKLRHPEGRQEYHYFEVSTANVKQRYLVIPCRVWGRSPRADRDDRDITSLIMSYYVI